MSAVRAVVEDNWVPPRPPLPEFTEEEEAPPLPPPPPESKRKHYLLCVNLISVTT